MIPYGRQDITEADIEAVIEVLKSDWITQGPTIGRFEQDVRNHCSALHSVAVSNATCALHIACLALELGPGDHLWTSPITFVASANCGLYCGATIDFVDIDSRTYNMNMGALEKKLEQAERDGKLPKVVIPVHFAGQSCDMRTLQLLAKRYHFRVIEDASHAIGAYYEDQSVGNCRYSDITIFSFHPVKIVTTGEGGMATTNNTKIADKMCRLRSHGITRDPEYMARDSLGPGYYEQIELGFNYRMTDIQAALGASQIQRLTHYVERRKELVARYNQLLKKLPLTLPWQDPATSSSWHLYVIRLNLPKTSKDRRQVFESMRNLGIGVNIHYIPVHTQPYYHALGFRQGMYPEAERYYSEAITLPLFPTMTEQQQDKVVAALEKSLA